MRTVPTVARLSTLAFAAFFVLLPAAAVVGADVSVKVHEITDNRVTEGPYVGRLEIELQLDGENLDEIHSARVLVTEAVDDGGNDLLSKKGDPPDFVSRSAGQMKISLENPPRTAKAIKLSGKVELFVPSKDPDAIVSIENALAKLDTRLKARAFDTEKMNIQIVAPETHRKGRRELGPEQIEELREQGRKEGVSEEEIDVAIEFALAMQAMAGEATDDVVILSGSEADIDRILQVRLLRPDGSEISIPSRSWSGSDEAMAMVIEPEEKPPADTTLQLTVRTTKATVSVPFSLSGVELP